MLKKKRERDGGIFEEKKKKKKAKTGPKLGLMWQPNGEWKEKVLEGN